MAVLSLAKGFVGSDGGLHHAAAALNIPATVVWGGFASYKNLGYPDHINIHIEDENTPCGEFSDCLHCRAIMDSITPEMVIDGIQAMVAK
jgi:ADP-heptose:LPS heptosyltransferase